LRTAEFFIVMHLSPRKIHQGSPSACLVLQTTTLFFEGFLVAMFLANDAIAWHLKILSSNCLIFE